jgi:phosphoglycolate phosphatase
MKITHLLWDWNGTLLDDIEVCLQAINSILREEDIPEINKDGYRKKFCFPIRKYYENVGLDVGGGKFEIYARRFIERYQDESRKCGLVKNAETVLKRIGQMGIEQIVLSASRKDLLEHQVADAGVRTHFKELLGLDDIHAASKKEIGLQWKEKNKINGANILMVGDTFHDYEVAQGLGAHFLYYTQGHQNIGEDEIPTGRRIDDLSEAIAVVEAICAS